ncbi:MAG: radical SAM protein [Bacteroidales bacterium]
MIRLSGIHFLATYNCNAACRHCFFDTKSDTAYMNPEIIDMVYADEHVAKHMFWNHISGGELMLQHEKLYALVSRIRRYFRGDVGISTNGYWATSPQIADTRLQELQDAGVNGISVSADIFHHEYISQEYVKNAVQSIVRAGFSRHSYVIGSFCNADVFNATLYNKASEAYISNIVAHSSIPVARPTIRSIGKGNSLNFPKRSTFSQQDKCTDLSECLGKRGLFNPAMVYVDVYGNVMICPGIIIGNLYVKGFSEIIENFTSTQHILLEKLATSPYSLYTHAVAMCGETLPKFFYDVCDMCYTSRLYVRSLYPEVLGPVECYP